jgi:hypothetical protein
MRNEIIPFKNVLTVYHNDSASKHLRLGQWFMNRFMPKHNDDKLYNSVDNLDVMKIIYRYYLDYDWPMAEMQCCSGCNAS